jgi:hypothetical protein
MFDTMVKYFALSVLALLLSSCETTQDKMDFLQALFANSSRLV